jgi:chemotaxis protein histidine kinase CheA
MYSTLVPVLEGVAEDFETLSGRGLFDTLREAARELAAKIYQHGYKHSFGATDQAKQMKGSSRARADAHQKAAKAHADVGGALMKVHQQASKEGDKDTQQWAANAVNVHSANMQHHQDQAGKNAKNMKIAGADRSRTAKLKAAIGRKQAARTAPAPAAAPPKALPAKQQSAPAAPAAAPSKQLPAKKPGKAVPSAPALSKALPAAKAALPKVKAPAVAAPAAKTAATMGKPARKVAAVPVRVRASGS